MLHDNTILLMCKNLMHQQLKHHNVASTTQCILDTIVDALPVQHVTNSSGIHKGEYINCLITTTNVVKNAL